MDHELPSSQRLFRRLASRFIRVREALVVALLACLSIAVHGHFRLPGMGELDAARFGRIAFLWHVRKNLSFDGLGYQIRTSTLYLQLEKVALDHGVAMHSLPNLVNWVSVCLGTACSVALYVLFRKLTTRPIAIAATLVHALTPGFFLGNLYGMPTVPGMFFFVLGVIAFLSASRSERAVAVLLKVSAAWLCMTIAMTLKSDLALGGGAFLAVALARRTQRWRWVVYASAVVLGGTLGSIRYTHAVILPATAKATTSVGFFTFLKTWNKDFAVTFDALLSDSNNTTIVRCAGGLLFCVIVLALIYGLVMGQRLRKQALLALLWGLPPILAWGVRFGNSARHNVPAFPPLVLFAVIFLFEIAKHQAWRAYALVACVMVASYFSNTSGEDSLRPQSNLLELADGMSNYVARMHRKARKLADTPGEKRALVAGYADPYTEFELLSDMHHPVIEIGDAWVLTEGGRTTVIDYRAYAKEVGLRELVRRYHRDGYEVLSLSYKF